MDIEVEEEKGGPLSLCTPGHSVFLSLMVTSRPDCCHCHSGIATEDNSTLMSLKNRQPCFWCNSKHHSGSCVRLCMVLIFQCFQARSMHEGVPYLHAPSLQGKAQKCWRGKSSQSNIPERVCLKAVSQLLHFLLCMESSK